MFRTCIHCMHDLKSNEFIEAMPIGRRLAFDSERGRLWVVCRKCERWNLTPFEERWEAIEQCERAFRGTRVRVSTDHVGLARLADGTELVRIGRPLRPEFAAWRYGDQFGRRRRKSWLLGASSIAAAGVMAGGAVVAGSGLLTLVQLAPALSNLIFARYYVHAFKPLRLSNGEWVRPAGRTLLINHASKGWGLQVGYSELSSDLGRTSKFRGLGKLSTMNNVEVGQVKLFGEDAQTVLRWLMPLVNRGGGSRKQVSNSVQLIEDLGDPALFPEWASKQMRAWGAKATFGDTGGFETMPAPARLALEMAINEDNERRAMEGELITLERAWADAEEVAAIADSLLTPAVITNRLQKLKLR